MEALVPMGILFVILPWILFHYITKWKEMKGFTPEDEATLTDLRKSAERLEDRLRTVERILDSEVPDWRSRHHDL
ncbi:envelope stress response membrane protein PspB [Kordiimonas pumila]|uniref:Envelope stress response membrane protein PspB n=1 Tax=Kordiimonas pumila TaxID=2161677 RepID=A0ABV7D0A3_9PROT|nr:envelope stress response membrane protein PspB [Kordiimonas pumila]